MVSTTTSNNNNCQSSTRTRGSSEEIMAAIQNNTTNTNNSNGFINNLSNNICNNISSASSSSSSNSSSVSEFYNGKTVFITGGTGFMGKVLLEKLLRSCPGIVKIYLLIRSKKGQNANERLKMLLCSPLFDAIRKENPTNLTKLSAIEGDITQPELAINANDRLLLTNHVNIVFHSAATVKFDEKLKLSVTINMLGTQRLVELAKRMINLVALIHVSTAYCNCNRSDVSEQIYAPPIDPNQLLKIVDCLDEPLLDQLTTKLIGDRPNTYTFTKALAECWLKENRGDLPLVIVRPSIVLSSFEGPLKGWVDNWNGPTGIIAAAGKGLFRTMLCDPDKIADIVPVDMVINLMLVAAWRIGTTTKTKQFSSLPIYNCSTGQQKPITWKHFIDLSFKYMRKYPVSQVTWYPDGAVTASRTFNTFNKCLVHWLPAYILDGIVWLTGGKPIMVRIQDKLSKAATCLEYFTTNEWHFNDENVRQLCRTLSEQDRREFCFDVAQIDWPKYVENYVLGIRRFIFKEELTSIPHARQHVSRLFWFYRSLQLISVLCMWQFLTLRYGPLRQLWSNALRLLLNLARMLPFV